MVRGFTVNMTSAPLKIRMNCQRESLTW